MPILITVGALLGITDVLNKALETLVLPWKYSGRMETLCQTTVGVALQPHELDQLNRGELDDDALSHLLMRGVRQHQLFTGGRAHAQS